VTEIRERILGATALLLGLLGLAGCGTEKGPEFCVNHGPFHEQHGDELGSLTVTLNTDGRMLTNLHLPMAAAGAGATALLGDMSRVYTLQAASECAPIAAEVVVQGNKLVANYETSCGANNKLDQLDVHLFDSMPLLEEIEVVITTPVAEKHFAINRQCRNAIFRLP